MNLKSDESPAGELPSPRLTFPPWRRLRSSVDFAHIYEQRQKAGDRWLLIFCQGNTLQHTRIGLSVSRKHGNSVQRHRLRRLLKEAYRLEQHSIPEGLDLILIPSPESARATLSDYRRSLVAIVRRLVKRLPSPPQAPPADHSSESSAADPGSENFPSARNESSS